MGNSLRKLRPSCCQYPLSCPRKVKKSRRTGPSRICAHLGLHAARVIASPNLSLSDDGDEVVLCKSEDEQPAEIEATKVDSFRDAAEVFLKECVENAATMLTASISDENREGTKEDIFRETAKVCLEECVENAAKMFAASNSDENCEDTKTSPPPSPPPPQLAKRASLIMPYGPLPFQEVGRLERMAREMMLRGFPVPFPPPAYEPLPRLIRN